MIRINLLSEGRRPTAVRRRAVPLGERDWGTFALVGMLVLALVAVGVWWFVLDGKRSDLAAQVIDAEAEVARLEPILKQVEDYKAKTAELENKIQVITGLKNNQTGPVRVMDAVSRALPDLLWLDSMQVSADRIQLSGRAFNLNAISNFIDNLDKVPEFEEPQLSRAAEASNASVYEFNVTVGYSLTPTVASLDEDGAVDSLAEGG